MLITGVESKKNLFQIRDVGNDEPNIVIYYYIIHIIKIKILCHIKIKHCQYTEENCCWQIFNYLFRVWSDGMSWRPVVKIKPEPMR